jgi:hypothetical protein
MPRENLMTSPRKQDANRRNACLSTGPRTGAGKAKASQNARKYGLAVPVSRDTALAQEVREQANELATCFEGNAAPADLLALSETLIDLERVIAAQAHLTASLLESLQIATKPPHLVTSTSNVSNLVDQLTRLERYERRALSRQKSVLRRLVYALGNL